jgi:tetratricopeptide (TPR) repeat protein
MLLAARATFQKLGNQSEEAGVLLLLGHNAAETGIPAEAVRDYRDALERLNRLGKNAPPLLVFRTKQALADILYSNMNRDAEEARKLLNEAIELAARAPSIPRAELALAQTTRGATLMNEGKTTEAEAAFRQALETFHRENYEGIAKAMPYYYLAMLNARAGNFTAAREAARQYYEVRLRNLGPMHARTAEAKIMWARYRAETGETKEAVEQALEAMPTARIGLPPLSAILWTSLMNVSRILNLAGRFSEAETYAREGLAVLDKLRIPEVDARRGQTVFELGQALQGEKKYEAMSSLERSAGIFERLGPVWAKRAEQVRKTIREGPALPR